MPESPSRIRRWLIELGVIAVGVFTGLAAEGWAEARGERFRADELLGVIVADLRADSLALADARAALGEVATRIGPARAAVLSPDAHLVAAWDLVPKDGGAMNPRLRFRSGGYRALVSGGLLTAIPPELAAELSTVYEFEYGRIADRLDVVEVLVIQYFDRMDVVWNTADGTPRPGADVIGFANQMGRYGGVAVQRLGRDLGDVEARIGSLRAAITEHRGR